MVFLPLLKLVLHSADNAAKNDPFDESEVEVALPGEHQIGLDKLVSSYFEIRPFVHPDKRFLTFLLLKLLSLQDGVFLFALIFEAFFHHF